MPAATMLARLVFHEWPPHVDWKDHEFPASLNIADIACGTGTLLMAVAAEAERRHKRAGGKQAAELHKAMVEQALHGYDVQLTRRYTSPPPASRCSIRTSSSTA